MEACYARCNCWSDFPDMGGHITHEMDAWCFQDACWCSYNQVSEQHLVSLEIVVRMPQNLSISMFLSSLMKKSVILRHTTNLLPLKGVCHIVKMPATIWP